MIQNILIASVAAVAIFVSAKAIAQKDTESAASAVTTPVVVELFTSQSCSSCPPADRNLSELAKNKNIIALACHVSYWNHLHWKDTQSHEFCDMRQHGYSSLRGDRRVYTPQMIVNGKHQFVGSHSSKIKQALSAAQQAPLKNINITFDNSGTLNFTLPSLGSGNYRIWAYGYKNQIHQKIPSGENRGLSQTYSRPVATYDNLGAWDGTKTSHSFDKPDAQIDGIAILAQRDGYGEIVAAGKLEF